MYSRPLNEADHQHMRVHLHDSFYFCVYFKSSIIKSKKKKKRKTKEGREREEKRKISLDIFTID